MRIEVLREFRDLAHSLNFTAAAKQLHMTQPKLSKHMIELENEIGFNLFNRGKEITLTPAGKIYLGTVAKMLHMHDTAVTEGKRLEARDVEEIRLVNTKFSDEAKQLLLKSAHNYKSMEKDSPVRFVSHPSQTGLEAVAEGKADIAVVMGGPSAKFLKDEAQENRIVLEEVLSIPLVVLGSKFQSNGKELIQNSDLENAVFAMPANQTFNTYKNALSEIFSSCPTDYNVYAVDSFDDLMLAKADEELLILTPLAAKNEQLSSFDDLKITPFEDTRFSASFYLAYRMDEKRPEVLDFVDTVIEVADKLTD